MRHDNRFTYVAGQITSKTSSEIKYRPVLGSAKHEWTYEVRAGQHIDLDDAITTGNYYYIIGEDVGTQHPYHVWIEIHKVTKETCVVFHEAHKSRKNQYEPLPAYLQSGILELGRDALNLWFIAQGENKGKEPSRIDYVTTLMTHRAKMSVRNQRKMDLAELEMARRKVLDELLDF